MRNRFLLWSQTVGAVVSAALGLLTLIRRDWLETFGWEPDRGNGTTELVVAVGLLVAAVALGGASGRRMRQESR